MPAVQGNYIFFETLSIEKIEAGLLFGGRCTEPLVKGLFEKTLPALISIILLFAIDWMWGNAILGLAGIDVPATSSGAPTSGLRTRHDVYHHGLSPSYRGVQRWGPIPYEACTNASGFKDKCSNVNDKTRVFDLAFIGDSYTEGVGLPYEKTFVGKIAGSLNGLKIANLAASSYSPSIYLEKLRYLLGQGYFFKEVVVYVDISDIQDEAIYYSTVDGKIVCSSECDRFIRGRRPRALASNGTFLQHFPVMREGLRGLAGLWNSVSQKVLNRPARPVPTEYTKNHARSAWTYNPNIRGYGGPGGAQRGIDKALRAMAELHSLLAEKGIALSVGVYPWPGQLLWDVEESEQVKIWRDFCSNRCRKFYNNFPDFFALTKKNGVDAVIAKYFFLNDTHYNPAGNDIIAENFLRSRD